MNESQVVTMTTIHTIVAPYVRAALTTDGFEEVGTLRWVRSADAPIRQVFCFFQWKGGMVAPSWGVSLDFVPHVSGSRLKWHRTAKTAMLDLRVDSRGRALDIPYHHGPEPIRNLVPHVVEAAVTEARAFWNRARHEADLLEAFRWTQDYYAQQPGLGFYNFVQHPLALAIVYARNRRTAEALAEFDKFGPLPDLDVAGNLRSLIEAAAGAA